MRTFQPYQILHIDLSEKNYDFDRLTQTPKYLVFWWKNIPLGEMYMEQNTSVENLEPQILKSITPALHQFQKDGKSVNDLDHLTKLSEFIDVNDLIVDQDENRADVSVIICTRNRSAHLEVCLSSLMKVVPKPFEILVVDNAPIDDSTKSVADKFAGVQYIVEAQPGLDRARNKGVRSANCSIVAFVDDDVQVHEKFISGVVSSFDNKDVMAMTGLVLAAELNSEAQLIFERHWPFNRGFVQKIYDKRYFETTLGGGPPVWEIGAGANMAFRRSIFEKIGYFDERLDVGAAGCNGDSELWFRILQNGFSIMYNPLAVVYHLHRSEMKALKKQLHYYMKGFTTAALIQHQNENKAGYRKKVLVGLPWYYLHLLWEGFPFYRFRFRTVFAEITGVIAGIGYYLRHKNKKAF